MFIQVLVDNKAKGQISKRVLKENKARQIFPPDTHDVLSFLVTPVLRFGLQPYYRPTNKYKNFGENTKSTFH